MRPAACLLLALVGCTRGGAVTSSPPAVPSPRDVATPLVTDARAAAPDRLAPAPSPPQRANCSGTAQRVFGSECWFEGNSCDAHGGPLEFPAEIRGTVVHAGAVHGGCTFTTFALVYERGTSPLRLRVCGVTPPGIECPAAVNDHARWDIAPLLLENHATRAVLVVPRRGRR